MARVVITRAADADVQDILSYLTQEAGHPVAGRYAGAFDTDYDRFARFPRIGPRRPALGAHARIWAVRPYVIVYDYIDDAVIVLRTLHGRRGITRRIIRAR